MEFTVNGVSVTVKPDLRAHGTDQVVVRRHGEIIGAILPLPGGKYAIVVGKRPERVPVNAPTSGSYRVAAERILKAHEALERHGWKPDE